jgi:ubiquitin
METHPSFAAFLGSSAAAPKATPKKRKSGTPDAEESIKETTEVTPEEDGGSPKKQKKAPARGRGRPKKTKAEEAKVEPEEDKAEPKKDNSADGGDGPSEYILNQKVTDWLNDSDIE